MKPVRQSTDELVLSWSYADIKRARQVVGEFLQIAITPLTSNTDLCRALGLPADQYRPQRLIDWANARLDSDAFANDD